MAVAGIEFAKRGRRLNDWSMAYHSRCGNYRVDRVAIDGVVRWRAMVKVAGCWAFLHRTRYFNRETAEEACRDVAELPEVCRQERDLVRMGA